MHEVEVWVLVDSDGNYTVAAAEEDLDGSELEALARRVVKVVLQVPVPLEVVLKGTVPAQGEAVLTSAE